MSLGLMAAAGVLLYPAMQSFMGPAPAIQPPPAAVRGSEPEALENMGKIMIPAKAVRQVGPSVPEGIRNRIVGEIPVELSVRIGKNGGVIRAEVSATPSDGLGSYLAQRAQEAVRSWKYRPATLDGEAAAAETTVRFRFRRSGTEWKSR